MEIRKPEPKEYSVTLACVYGCGHTATAKNRTKTLAQKKASEDLKGHERHCKNNPINRK